MTRGEYERKLGNAVRDFKGRRTTDGRWFRPPNPTAKARVERWIWRCRQAGMSIPKKIEWELLSPLDDSVCPVTSGPTENSDISNQAVLTEQPN